MVVIILGALHMAMGLFSSGDSPDQALGPQSNVTVPEAPGAKPVARESGSAGVIGETTSPIVIIPNAGVLPQAPAQPVIPAPAVAPKIFEPGRAEPEQPAAPTPKQPADVTGTLIQRSVASVAQLFPTAQTSRPGPLPPSIGSKTLLSAAETGDPAAAYEIATRYADGRGVALNPEAAAIWFERAARGGLVPAIFRLGGML